MFSMCSELTPRARIPDTTTYAALPPNDNNLIKRELQIITMVPIKVCHTVTWGVQPTNRRQGLLHFLSQSYCSVPF